MNSKIENLIKIALTDGVISKKDEEVILLRANELQLPKAEIEEINAIITKFKAKEQIQKKCPNCGAEISGKEIQCSSCDFLLLDVQKIQELDNDIITLENDFVKLKNFIPERSIHIFTPVWLFFSFLFLNFIFIFQFTPSTILSIGIVNVISISIFTLIFKDGIWFYKNYGIAKRLFKKQLKIFSDKYPKNLSIKNITKNFASKTKINSKIHRQIYYSFFIAFIPFIIAVLWSVFHISNITTNSLGKTVKLEPISVDVTRDSESKLDFYCDDIIVLNKDFSFVFQKEKRYDGSDVYVIKTDLFLKLKDIEQFTGHSFEIKLTLYKNGEAFFWWHSFYFTSIFNVKNDNLITVTLTKYMGDCDEDDSFSKMNNVYMQMKNNKDKFRLKYTISSYDK